MAAISPFVLGPSIRVLLASLVTALLQLIPAALVLRLGRVQNFRAPEVVEVVVSMKAGRCHRVAEVLHELLDRIVFDEPSRLYAT